jgi:hypothetical protein
MSYFAKLAIEIKVPEFDSANWRMAQVADVPNRDRYKYTLWEKEVAPPTPLHVYSVPEHLSRLLLEQLPQKLLDREIPGVYFMKMEIRLCLPMSTLAVELPLMFMSNVLVKLQSFLRQMKKRKP